MHMYKGYTTRLPEQMQSLLMTEHDVQGFYHYVELCTSDDLVGSYCLPDGIQTLITKFYVVKMCGEKHYVQMCINVFRMHETETFMK